MKRDKQKVPAGTISDEEVEQHIRDFFDRNYDLLRQEGGHVLAEGAKRQALDQALLYWRKLKALATSVTRTEEKLSLPGQVTPKGRPFVVEGVVDIVREGNEVRMYDLKTHEVSEVRAQAEDYQDQLNVYAYIWKGIRRQRLDGTAIIATRLPAELREAIQSGNPTAIREALDAWQPVVDLPFDEMNVELTIRDFGRCVDDIKDGKFTPPSPERLSRPFGTRRRKDHGSSSGTHAESEPTFAQIHCRNCDARFSCSWYLAYLKGETGHSRSQRAPTVRDGGNGAQLDAWIDENLADS